MSNVEGYYDANSQLEWQRADRHPTEFAVTRRALAEFLPPPPARLLDCGGGPGRYAILLAQQMYDVVLFDLSANNLALAKQKAGEAGVTLGGYVHGSAVDLSTFKDGEFEAALMLGPLYHLTRPADRSIAVEEAVRVLRPGGVLFAAFISLFAPLRDSIAKGYLRQYSDHPEQVDELLETHILNPGFTDAWFAHPDEVRPLMEPAGLRTLALLASEGLASGHEQHLNELEPAAFAYWADLHYRLSKDPYLLGAADHMLYIGQKEGQTPPSSDVA